MYPGKITALGFILGVLMSSMGFSIGTLYMLTKVATPKNLHVPVSYFCFAVILIKRQEICAQALKRNIF